MDLLEKYAYRALGADLDKEVERIGKAAAALGGDELLKKCFSMMDLTSLHNEDTPKSIASLMDKVNSFREVYPDFPNPASVCVFSNFAHVVASRRNDPEVHATVVSANFPTSQTFPQAKAFESRLAVEAGADEVDIVLGLNSFLEGDYRKTSDEIALVRKAVDEAGADRHICLKVILETGILKDEELIARASFLAMEAGADFIKTSTGKVRVNATPAAAVIMCRCIRLFAEKTGRKVGFKPAGGMSTPEDAFLYYAIVSDILGEQWLDKSLFRFGVSRMANNLLSAARKENTVFF